MLRQFELDAAVSAQQAVASDQAALQPTVKKSRVNTPWTPAEEQRLKQLRDLGQSWGEIAKVRDEQCVSRPGLPADTYCSHSQIGPKEASRNIGTR